MSVHPFKSGFESELVVVECFINGLEYRFAIGTAASDTILDRTALLLADGDVTASRPSIILEAASGKVEAQLAVLRSMEALGEHKEGFIVHVYDFLSNGLITEIDGLLGLDFFAGKKLCIDFVKSEITLS